MKRLLIFCLLLNGFFTATSQVGINTTEPDPSSALDIQSTESGILIPRMTQVQRDAIANPATGLMIYQTDNTPGFYYYEGSWKPFGGESHWTASGENIYNANNGNVGVGTATPRAKLHLVGETTPPILDKNFEDQSLNPLTTNGDIYWSTVLHGGSYVAKSGAITGNQISRLSYTAIIPEGGATLSFMYKTSSEASYDKLRFFINDAQEQEWSGNQADFSKYTVFLPQGTHNVKWEYQKDGSVDNFDDAAYIDNILITDPSDVSALRIEDGSQGDGKILMSDANGNAKWGSITNESIPNIPLIAAFGGMVIPMCNSVIVGTIGSFNIPINGVSTAVSWEVLQRITSRDLNQTHMVLNDSDPSVAVHVLGAQHNAERLQVRYSFDPPLPFPPNGLIFSANNNSNHPDTFSLNYASKSETQITMNITRNDRFGDTVAGTYCWQGQFYFDVFMTN